jgi:hypothetical protein
VEIVDLVENPELAAGDEIVAVPTLVRRLPGPMRKIIGDLSARQTAGSHLIQAPNPGRRLRQLGHAVARHLRRYLVGAPGHRASSR